MLEVYLLFFGKNCLILVFYILDVIIIKVIIFMIWLMFKGICFLVYMNIFYLK